jgi:hypothetical protein
MEDVKKYQDGTGLAKLYYKIFPSRNKQVSSDDLQFWRQAKALYMASDNWERLRQERISLAQGICEARTKDCETYASDIHHISYAHIGDEALWDLRAVCRHCHKKVSRG